MKKIKLAIVDDNETFRNAVAGLIQTELDLEILFQAENGKHLLELLRFYAPDIILMDIRMPVMDGIEASRKVKELYPELKIITVSNYDFEANIIAMNINGVKSFINKDERSEVLLRAIRIVSEGGVYMTDNAANIVQRYLGKLSKYFKSSPISISESEGVLIGMITDGLTSRQIGQKIHKSHRTVEELREKLYEKFNVKCKEQLIALAVKWNMTV